MPRDAATDETTNLELRWPADVFAAEARALLRLRKPTFGSWAEAVEFLLKEAFTGTAAEDAFRGLPSDDFPDDPWAEERIDTRRAFLTRLAATSTALPQASRPRPYWTQRNRQPRDGAAVAGDSRLADWFLQAVRDLTERGYFEHELPTGCEDAGDEDLVDPSLVLLERLGVPDLWPLTESRDAWDPATDRGLFYDLVEALHDLAARPRSRSYHSYWRHWHYADFSSPAGQGVYRWQINRLLRLSGTGLALAAGGVDAGRLVRVAGDERDELVDRVITTGPDRDTREHAVALYRDRSAGVPEKRSGIVALLGLLESRRELLKTELLSKDEGALFEIANQFALRHRRADQRGDYAEAYLDWLFWWYLATVDLTDQLLARQAGDPVASRA